MTEIMEAFTILYLSETGVGETIGERLYKESKEKGYVCKLYSGEKFKEMDWKESKLYFIICSSTGDGDPPEKCIKFWRWLKTTAPQDLLSGCKMALLALGDSNYSSYMHMPRQLHKRLKQLGAEDLLPVKEADDATPNGLESMVEPWIDSVFGALAESKGGGGGGGGEERKEQKQKYPKLAKPGFELVAFENKDDLAAKEEGTILLRIANAKYLTSEKAVKTVLHVSFESSDIPDYVAGDAFYIRAPNTIEDVEFVLNRLSEKERGVVGTKDTEFWPRHIPNPVECFQALSWYVDLAALPTKRLLRALAEYCTEEQDKNSLLAYCEISTKGKEQYAKLAEDRYGLVRLLKEHSSCVPPLDVLLSLLPVLKHRTYSVACMRKAEAPRIEIAFVVVRDREFMGCCTNWLLRLCELEKKLDVRKEHQFEDKREQLQKQISHVTGEHDSLAIAARFRAPVSFRFPETPLKGPLIMIGPGTGVAPFMGFCETIQHLRKQDASSFPENHLYFGCRDRSLDYLYREQLESFVKDGTLTGLHVAASRETKDKVYVQDLVTEQAEYIATALLEKGGHLFICGDARGMVPDVTKSIVQAFEKYGKMTPDEAKQVLEKMKDEKRYEVDCWA